MNKQQLIEKVCKGTAMKKADVEMAIGRAVSEIKAAVKKGDDVKLIGLGTFTKSKRKARTGRNPQTGKAIKIAAGWYPKFRAGSDFRETVK